MMQSRPDYKKYMENSNSLIPKLKWKRGKNV